MSMPHKKQFEILYNLKGSLVSIQRDAIKTHSTHQELSQKLLDATNYPNISELPYHQRRYITGMIDALIDSIYYTHVSYCHMWQGKLYTSWTDLPEDGKEFYRHHNGGANDSDPDSISNNSGFFWHNSHDRF